jgi:hypothetical protein
MAVVCVATVCRRVTSGPGKGCASVGLKLSTNLTRRLSRFSMMIFLVTASLATPERTRAKHLLANV